MKDISPIIINAVESLRWNPVILSEIDEKEIEATYVFAVEFFQRWLEINDPQRRRCKFNLRWAQSQYKLMLNCFNDYSNFKQSFGKWISEYIAAIDRKLESHDAHFDDSEVYAAEKKILQGVVCLVSIIQQIELQREQLKSQDEEN